jgi:hypothetical protein
MLASLFRYLSNVVQAIGPAWNQFWFTPRASQLIACIRIATALIALTWYLSISPWLNEWIGPEGLISLEIVTNARNGRWAFSIFDWVGNSYGLWLVYGCGVIALVEMLVGFKSRYATPIATVLVLSLMHRLPIMARPGEEVLALLMVYLSLAPTGDHWSVDAWLRTRSQAKTLTTLELWQGQAEPSRLTNLALRLCQIHLSLYWLSMAVAQLAQSSWWNGTALWGWVTRVDSRWVDVTWLVNYPYLVQAWSLAMILWLFCAAIFWQAWLRPLITLLGVLLWGSVAVTGGSFLFPALMITGSLAFWPEESDQLFIKDSAV